MIQKTAPDLEQFFLCHCEERNFVILTKEESHLLFIWAPISALRSRFFVRRCLLAKRAPLRSGRGDRVVERLFFKIKVKSAKSGDLAQRADIIHLLCQVKYKFYLISLKDLIGTELIVINKGNLKPL